VEFLMNRSLFTAHSRAWPQCQPDSLCGSGVVAGDLRVAAL
jgi:hypothetical protein